MTVPSPGPDCVVDLDCADSPAQGDTLVYSAADQEYHPSPGPVVSFTGGTVAGDTEFQGDVTFDGAVIGISLDDLSDVVVPAPNAGDLLSWDGGHWVNESPSAELPDHASRHEAGGSDPITNLGASLGSPFRFIRDDAVTLFTITDQVQNPVPATTFDFGDGGFTFLAGGAVVNANLNFVGGDGGGGTNPQWNWYVNNPVTGVPAAGMVFGIDFANVGLHGFAGEAFETNFGITSGGIDLNAPYIALLGANGLTGAARPAIPDQVIVVSVADFNLLLAALRAIGITVAP